MRRQHGRRGSTAASWHWGLLLHLLLLLQVAAVHAGNWMYLGMVGVTQLLPQGDQEVQNVSTATAVSICQHLPGLVQQQVAVCQNHPDAIRSVSDGARLGINECQYQFRNERWNCTTGADIDYPFGFTLRRGSKETAFIYAVTSAGVVHAVTQACSSGNLTDCSCDMSKQGLSTPEGWKWGGCSDNLRFGVQFARQFVDAPEKERHKKLKRRRNLMNLHNNEAGREAVARLMKMQCRCHGVSGSCELKTCWRSIPTFPVVGDYLKGKYLTTLRQFTHKKMRGSRWRDSSRRRRKRRGRRKRRFLAEKDELVHIHKSPNYCIQNPKKGILGTQGRFCNKTSHGADSCDLLCCGRGYNTQVVRYVERCHCKFVWCCHVQCKTCITNVDVHTCK
ncbi:protein Wnt-16-like isoform X3 [Portunus trituberculatus]|uniref:protein Wnt-16-like isoform X3 n=1 Tax=Portunus trituberculatus TaxID=210409 RepID=UPI001E1CEBC1|nr:protein Wnt-16-like isoform X3 [Portunus trituberculatus]